MTDLNEATVVDYTIEQLRNAIGSGRFAPGQRLIVSDITRQFSVSAGPVREAIRRLTGEGLIEIVPHRGASVREITVDDIREIHQLREAVEGQAARLAADNGSDPDFRAEMVEVREEMDLAAAEEDAAGFLENNKRFHDLIYRMTGNKRIRQVASQLILPLYQLRIPHKMTLEDLHVSYSFHQRIIAAVLSGKGAVADQAMREHVAQSGRGLIAAVLAAQASRGADRPRTRSGRPRAA